LLALENDTHYQKDYEEANNNWNYDFYDKNLVERVRCTVVRGLLGRSWGLIEFVE